MKSIKQAGKDVTLYVNEKNELHRLDGPAVEWADGSKTYYVDGKLHRLDEPAIELSDGTKVYYINGKHLSYKQISTITVLNESLL